MARTNQSIDAYLERVHVKLYNARHIPEILSALRPFHFDETRLDAGITLHDRAYNRHERQEREYGDQFAATKALQEAWDRADTDYTFHRDNAKLVFENDPDRHAHLRLYKPKPYNSFQKWLAQSKGFYHNLTTDTDALDIFSRTSFISAREITDAQARVREVERLNTVQEAEKSEAQLATKDRDQALDELEQYMRFFEIAVQRAIGGNQRLEALLMGPIP